MIAPRRLFRLRLFQHVLHWRNAHYSLLRLIQPSPCRLRQLLVHTISYSYQGAMMGYNSTLDQAMSFIPFMRGKEVLVGQDGEDEHSGVEDSPLRILFAAFTFTAHARTFLQSTHTVSIAMTIHLVQINEFSIVSINTIDVRIHLLFRTACLRLETFVDEVALTGAVSSVNDCDTSTDQHRRWNTPLQHCKIEAYEEGIERISLQSGGSRQTRTSPPISLSPLPSLPLTQMNTTRRLDTTYKPTISV
ncbi:hypothetical protein BLNAU_21974 [Blattamonas nauphoetae]|uniref:Uncharacterized protein n=1 Tax=Blattamonas nauphoetae TaxID=2049346 RepID=A0ABQ9WXF7_9EUKA|nr:hypothetical protein BLNAU_21974 [Blattamonas nauphoetae]